MGSVGKYQPRQEANIFHLIQAANQQLQSWVYWQYTYVHAQPTSNRDEGLYNENNGTFDTTKLGMLTQPYCRAVQGTHLSMHWAPETSVLECRVMMDPAVLAPTEVYLGPSPVSTAVSTTPANAVKTEIHGNVLHLFSQLKDTT